ncbi:dTDP-4-dehydrorhamnose reductase family protein [Propionivibrio sp.]|uniref:dTDP-4-dehydrorhamnose reductase family protein n=1 Tax=Propionivibrio sp. TaxID=2212460 RepID=UPI0039E32B7E
MNSVAGNVLVLGASGMLGNAVLRVLAGSPGMRVTGTVRSVRSAALLPSDLQRNIAITADATDLDSVVSLFAKLRPDVVINCVGLVKQLSEVDDPLMALPINALFPHRLARLCAASGARLVHLSTDCVFSGAKGMYVETDFSDAKDLYGRSKYLGEVDYPNAITLRTSIIGHELDGTRSLIGWFMSQNGPVKGYRKAIFSGLPTVVVARIIRDYVLPRPDLHGLFHLSAEPINKYDLLKLVARVYGKEIDIEPDDQLVIDRSLDSSRFRSETGFRPASWPELIRDMCDFS